MIKKYFVISLLFLCMTLNGQEIMGGNDIFLKIELEQSHSDFLLDSEIKLIISLHNYSKSEVYYSKRNFVFNNILNINNSEDNFIRWRSKNILHFNMSSVEEDYFLLLPMENIQFEYNLVLKSGQINGIGFSHNGYYLWSPDFEVFWPIDTNSIKVFAKYKISDRDLKYGNNLGLSHIFNEELISSSITLDLY